MLFREVGGVVKHQHKILNRTEVPPSPSRNPPPPPPPPSHIFTRPFPHAESPPTTWLHRLGQGLLTTAATATLLFSPLADAQTLTFPVSSNPELFEVQKTLVEAWTIVSEAYVDPSYNHVDWPAELSAELGAVVNAPSKEAASQRIVDMVAKLGDPFTRYVMPKDYADFRISSDGELKGGVGLLIAQDPDSGRLLVLAPIQGSPADRAGIKPGDEVLRVNGASVAGFDGETAAAVLRGEQGSSVMVEVARRKQGKGGAGAGAGASMSPMSMDAIPGVAGRQPGADVDVAVELKKFRLRRERVELSPVFATAMHFDDHNFGYVRLVNFSQKAAAEMEKAIAQLKKDGAEAFILDLRNNPGGLVRASLDVAGLWLDPSTNPTVFSVEDRSGTDGTDGIGTGEAEVQRVVLSGGHAATDLPLVVLVNRNSASASEILAGALRDNHRAEVIGDRTFGKGKIQSVFELADGSALFVTVAKYRTPAGTEIDQVGVIPDRACSALVPGGPESVPGIPVGPGADRLVIDELQTDACVLTAESVLDARVDASTSMKIASSNI